MKSIIIFLISVLSFEFYGQIPVRKLSLDDYAGKKIISITNSFNKVEADMETYNGLSQSDTLIKHISVSKPKEGTYLVIQEINRFKYIQGKRAYDSDNQFDKPAGATLTEGQWDIVIKRPVKIRYNSNVYPLDTLNEVPSVAYYGALWGYYVMSLNKNLPGIFLKSYPDDFWKENTTWKDSSMYSSKTYLLNKYKVENVEQNEITLSFESLESPVNLSNAQTFIRNNLVIHGYKKLKGIIKINPNNNLITYIKAQHETVDFHHRKGNVEIAKDISNMELRNIIKDK
jgi:hypothetical protein